MTRPDQISESLLSKASEIDQVRSEFLANQQADVNKLAEWYRDMN